MTFATRMAGGTAIGTAMRIGVSASPAQAGYIVDLMEKGGNVVATGSGNIDLTGLTLNGESTGQFALWPAGAHIAIGPTTLAANHLYISITGPTSFETGGAGFASSGTGDSVGILVDPFGILAVPRGYVSDTPLSDTSTYSSQTFISLGVTPGRYEWTRGSGAQLITTGSGSDTVYAEGAGGDSFVGGGGADAFTVTGHASADTFSYNSVSDSRNNTSTFDTITGFIDTGDGGSFDDVLNFSNISGLTTIQGSLSASPDINPHSIGWFYDAANNQTLVYANTGGSHLAQTSTSLMLVDLAGGNFHLSASNVSV
jgi:hypothetical protein